MIYVGFALAVGILGGMIYMALDKKTDPTARLASVIALGVMVLTVIICLFIALTDKSVPFDESVLIVGAPAETKKDNGNSTMILFISVFLIVALYAIVLLIALKERKKNAPKKTAEAEASNNFEF